MADEVQRVFQNQEIQITFPETGFALKPLPAKSITGYFANWLTHLKFCRQPKQPPHVQQVHSEDGWLCNFYILPRLGKTEVRAEVLKRRSAHTQISYQKEAGIIGEEAHQGHPMLVWREQSGKTRLDHFLIIGPKHNFLFVSSPYGDGEMLRRTVASLRFLDL
ncbi:MAG: hypothetical protein ACAI44_12890 [Candidatus Sericytochromatia bacterium]